MYLFVSIIPRDQQLRKKFVEKSKLLLSIFVLVGEKIYVTLSSAHIHRKKHKNIHFPEAYLIYIYFINKL